LVHSADGVSLHYELLLSFAKQNLASISRNGCKNVIP
jgi:hypothetical protein